MQRHPLRAPPAAVRPVIRRPGDRRPPPGPRDEVGGGHRPSGELARDAAVAAVEAALFLADEPLSLRKLAALAGLADAAAARRGVARLAELLAKDGSAFAVEELAGGYQLLTRPEFHPWVARLRQGAAAPPLGAAAREVLTIIAYRQPVTRADIEAIRGVGAADALRQLVERGLVRIAGRDDSLGRPVLYETTRRFLQAFGLRSLKDLPPGEGLFAGERRG